MRLLLTVVEQGARNHPSYGHWWRPRICKPASQFGTYKVPGFELLFFVTCCHGLCAVAMAWRHEELEPAPHCTSVDDLSCESVAEDPFFGKLLIFHNKRQSPTPAAIVPGEITPAVTLM
jgi:hypothetical protein